MPVFSNPSVSFFGITNSSALSGLSRCRDNPLIGADSNVFNLIGLAARTLKENDMADAASEMTTRVTGSGSYDEALGIIVEYVTPVSIDEYESEDFDMRM